MADINNLNNYQFKEDDFELVQNDKKIFDQKFETKPTTFIKDALKRFRKNKSSVAGAIILGIIAILAFLVPVISKSDIDTIQRNQQYLAPKVFEAGTGFWDGMWTPANKVVYDTDNETPANFNPLAVRDVVRDEEPTYINRVNDYGHNGYIKFVSDNSAKNAQLFSPKTTFNAKDDVTVSIEFLDDDNIGVDKLGEYRITLVNAFNQEYVLQDWSKNYNKIEINISEKLKEENLTSLKNTSLVFEMNKATSTETLEYILIKNCVFNCKDSSKVADELRNVVSFTDANKMALVVDANATNYWRCIGKKEVYKNEIYFCTFKLDTYEDAFGLKEAKISWSKLEEYKSLGYCDFVNNITYDKKTKEYSGIDEFLESFTVLDEDKCPIVEIVEISNFNPSLHKPTEISIYVYKYKELGYKKAPKYIFGTDVNGQDLFKKCFFGLRNSFGLAAIIASFCFIFGLIWGAISGYFGGYTDLFMERFCDILGRVPDLLVISLLTIHLGSGYVTFIIALTMTGWMGTAGLTRTQFYRFKGREYVLASRTLGASDGRLIFKHILPNSMGTIVTSSVFMITSVIRSEASFAYLHIGLDSSNSFGVILSDNQQYINSYPHLIVVPSVIMGLMMISFNLFGNGLRDALNPSLKGSD